MRALPLSSIHQPLHGFGERESACEPTTRIHLLLEQFVSACVWVPAYTLRFYIARTLEWTYGR